MELDVTTLLKIELTKPSKQRKSLFDPWKIFGEREDPFSGGKGKGGQIFGECNIFFGGEQKLRRTRRKIFGEGKYFFVDKKKNGEGIGGKPTN